MKSHDLKGMDPDMIILGYVIVDKGSGAVM